MSKILPRGNPKSKIWVVTDKPYEKDSNKGYVFSSGYGYVFDNAWRDAGIKEIPFICAISDIDSTNTLEVDYKVLLAAIDYFKPPFILPLGKTASALFCPETRQKRKGVATDETSLEKYAGSLLSSPDISYPHYVIPQLSPDAVVAHWEYRTVYVGIDLEHVRTEWAFYNQNNGLQPLLKRDLIIQPSFDDLIGILYEFRNARYLASDIETIRPTKSSEHYGKHPGYPYTLSLADSPQRGVSFSLWDYKPEELVTVYRELDRLFSTVGQIGQNYFTFDTHFLEALGFSICLEKCEDTMLRHQILWPELPHKLQFLTKQYTRQPYYKDEGIGWSPKNKKALMHYNALDSTVTYEVYLGQENEFADRPYLR